MEQIAPELCNSRIVRRLAKSPPEFLPSDDLSWLTELIPQRVRANFDLQEIAVHRLPNRFSHLRAYHGCRPKSTETYRAHGIKTLDPSLTLETMLSHFSDDSFPEVTPDVLRSALTRVDTTYRQNRIFFESNRKLLLDYCGHYLLYGSEYIVGVLRSIPGGQDYAQVLKRTGVPTLLICDVPMQFLTESTLFEMAGRLISTYYKLQLFPHYIHPQVGEGFGFEIYRRLPADLIVSIENPVGIRDPI